ncbi:hypothetical protein RN001_014208 [Aquatica leii]|uniref:Uncharacterized protein n=1 Tax=Aquatica leii TaxID=1421715 RepID=A0AAN7QDR4_9COLE|nr:hypothetical protein RN001_014208 [Aquatica leii]
MSLLSLLEFFNGKDYKLKLQSCLKKCYNKHAILNRSNIPLFLKVFRRSGAGIAFSVIMARNNNYDYQRSGRDGFKRALQNDSFENGYDESRRLNASIVLKLRKRDISVPKYFADTTLVKLAILNRSHV